MNFSEIVSCTLVAYSHSGDYIAISKRQELFIYDSDKLSILYQYKIDSNIERIEWSPDDKFVMMINIKEDKI
jgi:hypothetical protein